jgi:hypothetical protein
VINESKRGEILIKNFEDPATFDARVDIRVEKLTRDDLLDLSEIGSIYICCSNCLKVVLKLS